MNKHILYSILALLLTTQMYASIPTWTVIPSGYQNSMTITGVIQISGIESIDTNDMIGVFVGTECRGMGQPIFLSSINRYLVFLVVQSNTSSGENLSFKIYDASGDSITTAMQNYSFASFGVLGTIANPFVWSNNIVQASFPISGIITYDNNAKTPINNAKIVLKSNGVSIDSVITNSLGNYTFSQRQNGTYTITVSTTKPWGGVNSTDALLIQRHFAGLVPIIGNKKLAADVNISGSINSADALLIKRRFATIISSFALKDWVFNVDTVVISGNAVVKDITAICAGDVNASYTPLSSKTGIILKKEGVQSIVAGQEFDLQIRNQDMLSAGAISLIIDFPTNLIEIKSIKSKAESIASLTSNISNGKIYVAWNSIEPFSVGAYDTILTIRMKYIGDTALTDQMNLILDANSEFADSLANIINGVTLSYPKIVIPVFVDESFDEKPMKVECIPNPFSQFTQINYNLPHQEDVTITFYDVCGKVVREIFLPNQSAGINNFVMNSDGLEPGIYFCKIGVSSNNDFFFETKKLILNK